jgi:hypothetical protein
MKQPRTVFLQKEKESDEELMARFGLKQEEGNSGWGDDPTMRESQREKQVWGQPSGGGVGW